MGGGFLGVGPAELVVIFILMLVVAGPKRMIAWAYQAGKITAQLRAMFQETMQAFQKEMEAAGLDPELQKTITDFNPRSIVSQATSVIHNEIMGSVAPAQSQTEPPPPAEAK